MQKTCIQSPLRKYECDTRKYDSPALRGVSGPRYFKLSGKFVFQVSRSDRRPCNIASVVKVNPDGLEREERCQTIHNKQTKTIVTCIWSSGLDREER